MHISLFLNEYTRTKQQMSTDQENTYKIINHRSNLTSTTQSSVEQLFKNNKTEPSGQPNLKDELYSVAEFAIIHGPRENQTLFHPFYCTDYQLDCPLPIVSI